MSTGRDNDTRRSNDGRGAPALNEDFIRAMALARPDRCLVAFFSGAALMLVLAVAFVTYSRLSEDCRVITCGRTNHDPSNLGVAFLVHVAPDGATLKVNGAPYPEPVGVDGVLIETVPAATVMMELSKAGHKTVTRFEQAPTRGTRSVYVSLPANTPPSR